MHINPKQDLLFESVKQMVIETRTPSISLAQRTFRINYSRAASMLAAMEGDTQSNFPAPYSLTQTSQISFNELK